MSTTKCSTCGKFFSLYVGCVVDYTPLHDAYGTTSPEKIKYACKECNPQLKLEKDE